MTGVSGAAMTRWVCEHSATAERLYTLLWVLRVLLCAEFGVNRRWTIAVWNDDNGHAVVRRPGGWQKYEWEDER